MAQSKAHIKASAKYNAKTYKSFTVNMKINDYSELEQYCSMTGKSKAAVITESCKMYMEANPVQNNSSDDNKDEA